MSNERVRIQVKTGVNPDVWEDVGSDSAGVPVPIIDGGLPTEGNNPSFTVTAVTVGTETTTTLEKVIGATTYTKIIIKDTSTGVTTVGEWS